MTKQAFIAFLTDNISISELNISEFRQIIEEHPYFQTAWILYLKSLYKHNHLVFKSELRKGSIQISDRKKLYTLIHQKESGNIENPDEQIFEQSIQNTSITEEKIESIVVENEEPTEIRNESNSGEPQDIKAELLRIENEIKDISAAVYLQKQIDELRTLINIDKKSVSEKDTNITDNTETLSPEEITIVKEDVDKKADDTENPIIEKKKQSKQLIDNFLKSNPRIKIDRSKLDDTIDLSEKSTKEPEGIMTETLASIYIKQGQFNKALNIYEKLSLKYPEKNHYFAAQIQKIKHLQSNN